MHIHSPNLQGIRPLTLMVWVQGRVEQNAMGSKKCKKLFRQILDKYQDLADVICCISHKKVMDYFRFFYTPCLVCTLP